VQNLADRRFDLYRIEWDKRVGNIKDPLGEKVDSPPASAPGARGHGGG
jgi:hypothetical protein